MPRQLRGQKWNGKILMLKHSFVTTEKTFVMLAVADPPDSMNVRTEILNKCCPWFKRILHTNFLWYN